MLENSGETFSGIDAQAIRGRSSISGTLTSINNSSAAYEKKLLKLFLTTIDFQINFLIFVAVILAVVSPKYIPFLLGVSLYYALVNISPFIFYFVALTALIAPVQFSDQMSYFPASDTFIAAGMPMLVAISRHVLRKPAPITLSILWASIGMVYYALTSSEIGLTSTIWMSDIHLSFILLTSICDVYFLSLLCCRRELSLDRLPLSGEAPRQRMPSLHSVRVASLLSMAEQDKEGKAQKALFPDTVLYLGAIASICPTSIAAAYLMVLNIPSIYYLLLLPVLHYSTIKMVPKFTRHATYVLTTMVRYRKELAEYQDRVNDLIMSDRERKENKENIDRLQQEMAYYQHQVYKQSGQAKKYRNKVTRLLMVLREWKYVAEKIPFAIGAFSHSGNIIGGNDTFYELLSLSRDRSTGRTISRMRSENIWNRDISHFLERYLSELQNNVHDKPLYGISTHSQGCYLDMYATVDNNQSDDNAISKVSRSAQRQLIVVALRKVADNRRLRTSRLALNFYETMGHSLCSAIQYEQKLHQKRNERHGNERHGNERQGDEQKRGEAAEGTAPEETLEANLLPVIHSLIKQYNGIHTKGILRQSLINISSWMKNSLEYYYALKGESDSVVVANTRKSNQVESNHVKSNQEQIDLGRTNSAVTSTTSGNTGNDIFLVIQEEQLVYLFALILTLVRNLEVKPADLYVAIDDEYIDASGLAYFSPDLEPNNFVRIDLKFTGNFVAKRLTKQTIHTHALLYVNPEDPETVTNLIIAYARQLQGFATIHSQTTKEISLSIYIPREPAPGKSEDAPTRDRARYIQSSLLETVEQKLGPLLVIALQNKKNEKLTRVLVERGIEVKFCPLDNFLEAIEGKDFQQWIANGLEGTDLYDQFNPKFYEEVLLEVPFDTPALIQAYQALYSGGHNRVTILAQEGVGLTSIEKTNWMIHIFPRTEGDMQSLAVNIAKRLQGLTKNK